MHKITLGSSLRRRRDPLRGSSTRDGVPQLPSVSCRLPSMRWVSFRVALLAEHLPEVVEMDVNPVIVGAEHVSAVDVAVRLAPWEPHPELAVRRLR